MSSGDLKRLHAAFDAVYAAAGALDDSEEPCGACGLRHKLNWPEARAKADLMGAAARIARALDVLEDMAAKAPRKEKSA